MINLGFKNYLIKNAILKESDIEDAFNASQNNGTLLQDELVRQKLMDEKESYKLFAEYLNIPYRFVQLSELNVDIIRQFPMDRLDEFKALPIAEDDTTITFILSNPFRAEELREFSKYTQKQIKVNHSMFFGLEIIF